MFSWLTNDTTEGNNSIPSSVLPTETCVICLICRQNWFSSSSISMSYSCNNEMFKSVSLRCVHAAVNWIIIGTGYGLTAIWHQVISCYVLNNLGKLLAQAIFIQSWPADQHYFKHCLQAIWRCSFSRIAISPCRDKTISQSSDLNNGIYDTDIIASLYRNGP